MSFARSFALASVLLALLATAIELSHDGTVRSAAVPSTATDTDLLRGEMLRCRSLREAGAHDEPCLRAWAENRRRFLATSDRRPPAGGGKGE